MQTYFGKYELVERMASGGMAEIFRARVGTEQGVIKTMALKRILAQHSRNPEFVRLFINEARVAARLHHTNIVQIYEFGEMEDRYYLAMELVDGWNLRQVQKRMHQHRAVMDLPIAVHVVSECLKGLNHAHTAKDDEGLDLDIIHRDISPHNILLSKAGEVKLADFGIAKAAITTGVTVKGLVRGKLTYMAPEQIQGQPLSQRTDIFALGTVFYELVTGNKRYKAEKGKDLAILVSRAQPPDREELMHLPEPLFGLLSSLMAKDPDMRPDAMSALRQLRSMGWVEDRSLELTELLQTLFQESASSDSFPTKKTPEKPPGPDPVTNMVLPAEALLTKAPDKARSLDDKVALSPDKAGRSPDEAQSLDNKAQALDNTSAPSVPEQSFGSPRFPSRAQAFFRRAQPVLRYTLLGLLALTAAALLILELESATREQKSGSASARRPQEGALLIFEGNPPKGALLLDGAPLEIDLSQSVVLTPKEHEICLIRPDGTRTTRKVRLEPRSRKTMRLDSLEKGP